MNNDFFKAVIFDMDGTMAYTEPLHFKAFSAVFAEFGVTWEYNEFINKYSGTGSHNIISSVLKDREKADAISDPTGRLLDALALKKKEFYIQLVESSDIAVVNGLYEFVEMLKSQSIPYLIASGTNADNVRSVLSKIGLAADFPVIISGEDIKSAKPAPDIFLLAAEKLGVKPEDCMVLEDAVAGVKAAKSAKMYCVGFTTTTTAERLSGAGADMVVDDYFGLMEGW